ncbi:MAG: hypothetical protein ORN55_04110 [Chitinophagaceae bacterium]|nr:hypothetical protein [Chitinophagaceae bacterium]
MKLLFLHIIFICCGIAIYAQDVQFSVGVDSNEVLIGDVIHLTVKLSYPTEKYALIFPNINEMFTSPFKIIEQGKIDTTEGSRYTTMQQTTTIASYDSGLYMLPKLHVNGLRTDADSSIDIIADSLLIRVSEVPININGDIKDIIDTQTISERWKKIGIISAMILLVLLIIGLIIYWWIEKRKLQKNKPINVYDVVMKRMKAIENNLPNNIDEAKEYYSTITDSIKYYIQQRWKMPITDKTSMETIRLLQEHKHTLQIVPALQNIFSLADMVKFAKMESSASQNKENYSNAINIIQVIEKEWQVQQELLASKKVNG